MSDSTGIMCGVPHSSILALHPSSQSDQIISTLMIFNYIAFFNL